MNNNTQPQQPAPKDAPTIAHEKVLRLECLKLVTNNASSPSKTDLALAKSFSYFVINGDA